MNSIKRMLKLPLKGTLTNSNGKASRVLGTKTQNPTKKVIGNQ